LPRQQDSLTLAGILVCEDNYRRFLHITQFVLNIQNSFVEGALTMASFKCRLRSAKVVMAMKKHFLHFKDLNGDI
jgi:hypothetical protein